MFEHEIQLNKFMLAYLKNVLKDVDEAQWTLPPAPGVNPPAWIVAHLAIVNDSALKIFGQQGVCPAEWQQAFGPKKSPAELTISYPSKTELLEKIEQSHQLLCQAVKSATPEAMSQPQPLAILKGSAIESMGDLVSHILATHFAAHIGQLSMMRRISGHAPIF